MVLFLLAAGLLFSGTVLKQDQEAVEALAHNNEIADTFGFLGFWFSADFTNNVSIVTRLYVAHVSILPVIVGAVLAVHMLLIKRHRISPLPWGTPAEVEARERAEHTEPFTSHLMHIGKWGLVLLGAVAPPLGACPRRRSARPASRASRSPSRPGTSSGSTRGRTGSASRRSTSSRRSSPSGCWRSRSWTARASATRGGAGCGSRSARSCSSRGSD